MEVKLRCTWPISSLLQFQIWLCQGVDDSSVPSQAPAALQWDKGYTVRAFPIGSDKTDWLSNASEDTRRMPRPPSRIGRVAWSQLKSARVTIMLFVRPSRIIWSNRLRSG